ncbi:hypothetical protein llap_4986 [Limosa lapponica baueri]|uniref:Uncharacterized protein n=1 Tax=Limosa lapponica baueri TaxID=1758121 RepID=A0A2I0UF85_LIMLA|nr:hypothetical protein llap_4986 [Limosa lapponica baueri]
MEGTEDPPVKCEYDSATVWPVVSSKENELIKVSQEKKKKKKKKKHQPKNTWGFFSIKNSTEMLLSERQLAPRCYQACQFIVVLLSSSPLCAIIEIHEEVKWRS